MEHAAKLGETAPWIGEKHQPQAAQHSIEGIGGEGKRLPVFDANRDVRSAGKALLRALCHLR